MPKRKQIIHLLILFFILIIIGHLGKNLNINYKEIVESKEHKNLRTSGYWVLDFIHVDGNWTQTNSTYDWCSGSGTEIDPYLIENVVIDGQNSSSCIIIENTNEYFEIRNCTLYNAGPETFPEIDCGIRVENCSNGNLINNNCSYNNYFGMFLDDCTNVLIQGNNLSHNNLQGLIIFYCQDCEIIGNTVKNNSNSGVHLGLCDYMTVLDNTISNNSGCGFYSMDGNHNYFRNNTVEFNIAEGFRDLNGGNNYIIINNIFNNNGASGLLLEAHNSTISGNTVNYNGLSAGPQNAGIRLTGGDNNTISDNVANFNAWYGIYIAPSSPRQCLFNNITRNNLTNNAVAGLCLWGVLAPVEQNLISENNITNPGEDGIQLVACHFNTIIGNNLDDNNYGINLNNGCTNNTVSGNTIKNSLNYGFALSNENENNTISGNTIINQSHGILMSICSNNQIIGNNISESRQNGVFLLNSDFNTFSGNIINYSDENGFYFQNLCNDNIILGNTISNSKENGISLNDNSNDNIITGNMISRSDINGILLDTNCSDNIISGNTISDNLANGIDLYDNCKYNIIYDNNIIKNNTYGIYCDLNSDNNNILDNIIYNNRQSGIYLYSSNWIKFSGNELFNNEYYGIWTSNCHFSRITENTIYNNSRDGLYLFNSDNNTISTNTIENNKQSGIHIRNCINHTIIGNIIKNNVEKGMYIWDTTNLTITGSSITDNGENGIYLLTSDYNNITGNYLICYLECILEDTCAGNIIENNEYYANLTSTSVFIDGNSQWDSIASSEFWCNGTGTLNDPYIISHVYINGQNSGTCILIQNTTAYFKIEESMIFNSGAGSYDAGIKFINVTNGNIINNNCSLNQGSGIILLYCTNMTIFNNFVENNTNGYGCWLIWSDNNNLTGNTANYNDIGLGLNYSNYNDLIENFLDFNYYSINLGDSNNNTISGNIAFYNDIGLGLNYSNYNDITGNFLDFNQYGMILNHSNSNTISGNTLNNNSANGICLYYSNFNLISGNIINGNEFYGLYLFSSNNNSISFNTFIFNEQGIVEDDTSEENSYEDNDVIDRPNGEIIPSQPDNLIFIIIGVAGISLGIMGTIVYTQYRRIKRRKRTDWVKLKKKKGLFSPELDEYRNLIFISYATTDSDLFQIPLITKILTTYPEIDDVLYWESDMHDDIYEYMDDNLKLCKIFLLFCSQTSSASEAVKMEWRSALKLDKKIIPIFINPEHMPPLLTTKLGVQFDTSEVYDSIEDIYQMTLKKLEVPSTRQYCNYIIPKTISKDVFDQKIQTMKTKEIYFENDMSLDQIERELSSILQKNNFHIVETELDPINSELKGIKGFAEGKYDKQEISLMIKVQKVTEGNNLITIIAMSKKEWITKEILRDINVKSNNLKSTHELLREYSEKIEAVMEKIADLEDFLAKNLGPELEKLRDVLNRYNHDEISRSELINSGADLIGKNFLTAFIKRYFSEEMSLQKKEEPLTM